MCLSPDRALADAPTVVALGLCPLPWPLYPASGSQSARARQRAGDAPRLLQAVRDTRCTLLADPQYLGAQPGSLAALHTWSQPLVLYPPLPCLVTGGGRTPDGQWHAVRHGFRLPARVVRVVLRGQLLAALRQAWVREVLALPAGMQPPQLLHLRTRFGPPRKTPWNVPIRERSRHGAGVVTYVARSRRGGPITNAWLVACDGARVTCTCRPRQEEADGDRPAAALVGDGLPPVLAPARAGAAEAGGAL
jgi:hypothetical protein